MKLIGDCMPMELWRRIRLENTLIQSTSSVDSPTPTEKASRLTRGGADAFHRHSLLALRKRALVLRAVPVDAGSSTVILLGSWSGTSKVPKGMDGAEGPLSSVSTNYATASRAARHQPSTRAIPGKAKQERRQGLLVARGRPVDQQGELHSHGGTVRSRRVSISALAWGCGIGSPKRL